MSHKAGNATQPSAALSSTLAGKSLRPVSMQATPDAALIGRIATCDKLAMQVLFARQREVSFGVREISADLSR